MHRADIPFAVRLSDQEGWGIPARDFERILRLDPKGSFIATEGERKVGLTTTISYGTQIAWIGNVVVAKQHRGKHIGQALVHEAVRYLRMNRIKRIVLYSFNENVEYYRKLRFMRGPSFVRLRREGKLYRAPVPQLYSDETVPLRSLLSFDRKAFGADRSRLVKALLHSGSAWYVAYAAGSSRSYLMVKQYEDMHELGPWVSVGLRRAKLDAMLRTALGKTGDRPIEVSCLSGNRDVMRILKSHDFRVVNRGRIMYYQKISRMGQPRAIAALGFLDKG